MLTKQSKRKCVECEQPIPVERLRLLPDTWTCVRHSAEKKLTEENLPVPLDGTDNADMVHSAQSSVFNRR